MSHTKAAQVLLPEQVRPELDGDTIILCGVPLTGDQADALASFLCAMAASLGGGTAPAPSVWFAPYGVDILRMSERDLKLAVARRRRFLRSPIAQATGALDELDEAVVERDAEADMAMAKIGHLSRGGAARMVMLTVGEKQSLGQRAGRARWAGVPTLRRSALELAKAHDIVTGPMVARHHFGAEPTKKQCHLAVMALYWAFRAGKLQRVGLGRYARLAADPERAP